jgi:hypothetical protein
MTETAATLQARAVLSKPLRFGDTAQILAVRTIEAAETRAANGAKTYRVHVEISGYYIVEVEADSEEEAREEALEDWQDKAEVSVYRVQTLGEK